MNPVINDWKRIYESGYGVGPSSYIKTKILAGLLRKYKITNYADIGCGKGLLLSWIGGGQGYDIVKLSPTVRILDIQKNRGAHHQAVVLNALLEVLQDDISAARNISHMAEQYLFVITQWSGASRSLFDTKHAYRKYSKEDIQKLFPDFSIIESFVWGFPVYSLYYWLLELFSSKNGGLGASGTLNILTHVIAVFFTLDNLFKTRGRLLVVVLRRKSLSP